MQDAWSTLPRRDVLKVGLRLALAPAVAWPIGVRSQAGEPAARLAAASKESVAVGYAQWLRRELALPGSLPIDPDLREALRELARAHVARMEPVFRQWVDEEFAPVDSNAALQQASLRLNARFANEIALWRLPSPGPEYDAIWLRAMQRPAACSILDESGYFASQVAYMQMVPPAERPQLLEGERRLFAQWGLPRTALPDRPEVSQTDLVKRAVTRIRAGNAGNEFTGPPMQPVLAAQLLRDKVDDPQPATVCASRQWGLQLGLAQSGASAAEALVGYRYASMPTAAELLSLPPDDRGPTSPQSGTASYPRIASVYGVQGTTTLEVEFDGAGTFVSASVVARAITVPGIQGVRPVAFETVFDEAAIARTAAMTFPKRGGAPNATFRGRMDMNWKLS